MDSILTIHSSWIHGWTAGSLMNGYFGGHKCNVNLPNVPIDTLPVNSTPKNKPLHVGLIADFKIWYRSFLLRDLVHNTAFVFVFHSFFREFRRGKYCLRDSYMPHVGDAIDLFNQCWTKTKACTYIKELDKHVISFQFPSQKRPKICHYYRN